MAKQPPLLRCRHCNEPPVINMRQHKLALCSAHFVQWVHKQTQRTIEKYTMFTPEDRILVAVSGGKDSLALWDILLALGYQADGLYINLGISQGDLAYSADSLRYTQEFVANHETPPTLHVVDLAATYGATLPAAARKTVRGREKPCSLCGLCKRHIMNGIARDHGYNVLATGHNLDDEAATLFGNTIQWAVGYLARQGPVMPAHHPGLARKVKPLFRFYEREMAAYAIVRGIDYIYEECPYAKGASSVRYKEMLNQLEQDSPGIKLLFYQNFLKARAQHNLFVEADALPLLTCPTCGQPTTHDGNCAFCRAWSQIG